jgi:DNA-binding CsgD family transcriptional regulator
MGFVTLEKSEREELFKQRNPYTMSVKQLEVALDANAKEQLAVREYIQNLKRYGGSKSDIDTANKVWLALKTIHTQLSNIKRRAVQTGRYMSER